MPGRLRRNLVLTLLFLTYVLTYLDRAVMAAALPFIVKDFHLSSAVAGMVLSAFFLGYALMQIPAGMVADRVGPRPILVVAVAGWSIFTAVTGMAQSLVTLIAARLLFGISEGPAPAAVSKAISLWARRERLGRSNGFVLSGTLIGSAIAPLFVTAMVLHFHWRAAFLSLLVPGAVLTLALYLTLGGDDPARDLPAAGASRNRTDDNGASRWRAAVGSSQVTWCIIATFFASCANWSLQNWLPTYLLEARGFSIAEMGVFASFPFAGGALGFLVGGYLSDRFFAGRRQVPILLCLFAAALGTFGAAVADKGGVAVCLLTVTFFLLTMALNGLFTLPLLLVPSHAVGTAFGVVNTAAQIAGFLSPLLIGAVLDATGQDFAIALYGVVASLSIAAIAAGLIGAEPPDPGPVRGAPLDPPTTSFVLSEKQR